MSEPSEWAMEKARKVFKQLWVTDHGCDDVSEQRQTQDVFAIARALDEAKALNTEKETMLLNQAKTIKEMQAENEALRKALKPFARAGKLFPPLKDGELDMCIYAPVAGPEYKIAAEDLRRARAVYEGEK